MRAARSNRPTIKSSLAAHAAASRKSGAKSAKSAEKTAAAGGAQKARPAAPRALPGYAPARPASAAPKPRLGYKWECFSCDAKFYDLGSPEPLCPRCGADQRKRPLPPAAGPAPAPAAAPKPQAPQPMDRFLGEAPESGGG